MIFACEERNGTYLRRVEVMGKTPQEALWVYDNIRSCLVRTGWDEAITLEWLLRPETTVLKVDKVGVLCFVRLRQQAHAHVFFWDRILRGREGLCRKLALMMMDSQEVELLLTAIPPERRTTIAFAKRVGFQPWMILEGKQYFWANPYCFTMKHQGVNHGNGPSILGSTR
jgi:hypothetical protein